MSWGATTYLQFADEVTGTAALASALDITPDDGGSLPTDPTRFALVSPITEWQTEPVYDAEGNVTTPGVRRTGWWAMLRLNSDWDGAADAATALAPYVQQLADPCNVFAD